MDSVLTFLLGLLSGVLLITLLPVRRIGERAVVQRPLSGICLFDFLDYLMSFFPGLDIPEDTSSFPVRPETLVSTDFLGQGGADLPQVLDETFLRSQAQSNTFSVC